jgi:zona occludens toxin (predicted ATPase)
MARDCHNLSRRRSIPIFANFALKGAHYFNDISQILNVERGLIAIDELNTLCPASKWQQLPISYVNLWTQSRKNSIDLLYTTQNFKKVVSSIRDVTNYVWHFTWFFGRPPENTEKIRLWHKIHKAKKFDGWDAEKERITARPIQKYVFIEKKAVYKLYDTSFRVRPPAHLMEDFEVDLDPEELPYFDENLKLTNENQ